MDERIRMLLRVAIRAEGEGDDWVARILRRRAEELRPLDVEVSAEVQPVYGLGA